MIICYTYFGYPILLSLISIFKRAEEMDMRETFTPSVSMIIPVFNEEAVIADKISNTLALAYPRERFEVIVVSDGSTDRTNEIMGQYADSRLRVVVLGERGGKAAALNRGLREARHEIVVFSDASILLEKDSLRALVSRFRSHEVGCVSGEDHIPTEGGEAAYGRYELLLRNLESRIGSTVAVSGCFYGQRRALCSPFPEGMAPDFLSVLNTVERGQRVVTEPAARGEMKALNEPGRELTRKVRTLLRGMTALSRFRHLLNPFRYGFFAIELLSHKVMRWGSGVFFGVLLLSNAFLLGESPFYALFFLGQVMLYVLGFLGWTGMGRWSRGLPARIAAYICVVNASSLLALVRFLLGQSQELWEPSRRS